jgi:hypothetical protein
MRLIPATIDDYYVDSEADTTDPTATRRWRPFRRESAAIRKNSPQLAAELAASSRSPV